MMLIYENGTRHNYTSCWELNRIRWWPLRAQGHSYPEGESLLLLLFAAQASAQQPPLSPGSSPHHWTTISFAWALGTAIIVVAIATLIRKTIFTGIKRNLALRIFVYFSEAIAAIALSVVGSYFDVFRKGTYVPSSTYQPDWHVYFWASVWAGIASYYSVVKFSAVATKESEESENRKLTEDLEKERAAVISLGRQRDLLVRIMAFARQMAIKKITRLSALVNSPRLTPEQFVGQLDPKLQLQSLVKVIHEYFRRTDIPNGGLRLALWMKDVASGSDAGLAIAYSWDGEKENCFSHRSRARMKLSTPLGTQSEVVNCYHSHPRTIKIIPNCAKASERQEFEFFYPEQKNKVQSVVLYKHVFMEQVAPTPVAVVVLLVSSVENYFREEAKDEIKQFLDEMLTRIEMEWIILELTEDLELEKGVA